MRLRLPYVSIKPESAKQAALLDIDDGDSQSERLENGASGVADSVSGVKIAVIRLPRMSNYTDFNALARTDGVSLLYCADVSELKDADLVIIPGTKNTIGDLRWMRANGIENAVKERARRGLPVIGICGGYQMPGGRVCDPCGAEGGASWTEWGFCP